MAGPFARARSWAALLAVLALPSASALSPPPADAAPHSGIQVRRGLDAQVKFRTTRPGEAFLDMSVAARRVSWAEPGHESAVVSLFVDGHYATDVVISSNRPTPRELALGSLSAGVHTLRIHYAAHRSRSRAGAASLRHLHVHTVTRNNPAYAAARYAPVLYGRNVPSLGGPFQSAVTDSPLVAWHEIGRASCRERV